MSNAKRIPQFYAKPVAAEYFIGARAHDVRCIRAPPLVSLSSKWNARYFFASNDWVLPRNEGERATARARVPSTLPAHRYHCHAYSKFCVLVRILHLLIWTWWLTFAWAWVAAALDAFWPRLASVVPVNVTASLVAGCPSL